MQPNGNFLADYAHITIDETPVETGDGELAEGPPRPDKVPPQDAAAVGSRTRTF
jgi:hypothetical protein